MNWIDVKEEQPDYDKQVLLVVVEVSLKIVIRNIVVGYRKLTDSDGDKFCSGKYNYRTKTNMNGTYVSHWMPFPEVPKVKKVIKKNVKKTKVVKK